MNESDIVHIGKISKYDVWYSPNKENKILMGRYKGESKFIVGNSKNLNEYKKILEVKVINKRVKL